MTHALLPALNRRVIRWGDQDIRNAIPHVFGTLVTLAAPIMERYHGDLFHDAVWLNKYATGREFSFTWSVGEAGTVIGTDEDQVRRGADIVQHRLVCRVTVAMNEHDHTVLTVERFALVTRSPS